MKTISIPEDPLRQERIKRSLRAKCAAYNAFFYIFGALAVLAFVGAIAAVIVLELRSGLPAWLGYTLLGSLLGGGAICGAAAYGFTRLIAHADRARLDFWERCDSEDSFYVGEGTLATFQRDALLLHGDGGGTQTIRIPYSEIRLISVCTRRAPKEKGEWSVVLELPARYLAKDKRAAGDEKVLVQTDAKTRLYDCIRAHGLTLLGEENKEQKNRRYVLKKRFYVPVPDKRRRSLIMTVLGACAAVAGIPVAILLNATAGSFLIVIGGFLGGRSLLSFLGAKSVFAVYEEGVYHKDSNGADRIFLKWEELERISRQTVKDVPALELKCIYGSYYVPDIAGVYEYLSEVSPEKCG